VKRMLIWSLGITVICLSLAVAGPRSGSKSSDHVEKFNLADLADGETRTFGEKDSAVTATRKGNDIVVTYGGGDGEKKTLHCTVGKETCYAMTLDGEGKKIMVFSSGDDPEGSHVVLDENDLHMTWMTADGDKGATGVKVILIHDDGGTVLSCPEGDATLVLKKGEEKTGPYFCPKHDLRMEKSKNPIVIKKIEVEKKSAGDGDDAE